MLQDAKGSRLLVLGLVAEASHFIAFVSRLELCVDVLAVLAFAILCSHELIHCIHAFSNLKRFACVILTASPVSF